MSEPLEQEEGLEALAIDSMSREPTIEAVKSSVPSGSVSHRPSLSLTSLVDLVRSQSPDPDPPAASAAGDTDSEAADEEDDEDMEEEESSDTGTQVGSLDTKVESLRLWGRDTSHDVTTSQSSTSTAAAPALTPSPPPQRLPTSEILLQPPHATASASSFSLPTPSLSPSTSPSAPPSSLAPLDRCLSSSLVGDDAGESWMHHMKHFFILSTSGKPIYSYHGEETALAGLMALITALVSVVQDQGDTLQQIVSGSTLIVFQARGPLLLVATTRLGEPILALQRQLELLYRQILLFTTTGLERMILRNPAYDPRSLLQGVDSTLSSLIHQVRLDPAYLLGALRPFPLPAPDRAQVQQVLADALKASPAYYALLMTGSYLVAYEKAKAQPALEPLDVMLLANFITSNQACSTSAGEVFCPVCLPGYNADAFLHAHITYLERDAETGSGTGSGSPGASVSGSGAEGSGAGGVYLVLLAGSSETFRQLSAARAAIADQLAWHGLLQRVRRRQAAARQRAAAAAGGGPPGSADQAAPAGSAPLLEAVGVPGYVSIDALPRPAGGRFGSTPLWHFMCRLPARQQMLAATPCSVYCSLAGRQLIACAYSQLHSLVMDCQDPARPNRIAWLATEQHCLLASLELDLELYVVLDPLTDEATAQQVADALRRHLTDKKVLADLLW